MIYLRSNNQSRGFTLLELLVVIGIMGLLMALLVPAFTGIGRGQGMRSSVTQLRTTLSLARQWAITRNEKTFVIFPDNAFPYSPPGSAAMAFRSYAVWAERSGYISEWRYLPSGVVFDPADADSGNLFNSTNDRVYSVEFPTNTAKPLQQMYCISFLPNGRLNQKGATSHIRLFLREGWVDINTNNGTASLPTILPNSTHRMYFECRPLTGGIRVGEL